jgi:hypothetical protein
LGKDWQNATWSIRVTLGTVKCHAKEVEEVDHKHYMDYASSPCKHELSPVADLSDKIVKESWQI